MPVDLRGAPHRPLVSGIRIVNQITGVPGTLGCIGVDTNANAWLVSCYHVLGRGRQAPGVAGNDEPILQSTPEQGGGVVARTRLAKMNPLLDFGAAIITPDIGVTASVFELDTVLQSAAAAVGMTVIKSGAETGLTTGVITEVTETVITIEQADDATVDYVLSDRGDSGAIWMDVQTGRAVGLHFSGRDGTTAFARPLGMVLTALQLRLLV